MIFRFYSKTYFDSVQRYQMNLPRTLTNRVLLFVSLFLVHTTLFSQDLEPRRWSVLPDNTQVIALGYASTSGDLFFDPVLEIEDASVNVETSYFSYVRSFSFAGKPVRFDALTPWQHAKWKGLLRGESAVAERRGFTDPRFRLSMTLLNTAEKEGNPTSKTVAGVALAVTVPLGQYDNEKLLNLGQNRYIIRPQVGVVHTEGAWSYELTGSIFFYTDNNELFNSSKREQDPLYALQSHVVYIFSPGVWTAVGVGYAWGGLSHINGVNKDDAWGNILSSLSFGFPLSKNQGLKLTYLNGRTQKSTGAALNTFSLGWSLLF